MDGVEVVKLGYLGMFMGMVDIVEVLWCKYLVYNFCDLYWMNRDCFVLLNGYGLMLFYSLFYFIGYDVFIDDFVYFC